MHYLTKTVINYRLITIRLQIRYNLTFSPSLMIRKHVHFVCVSLERRCWRFRRGENMSVGSAGQRREVADAVRRGRRRRRRCVARLWAKNHTKHRNGRHPERSCFLLFSFLFFCFPRFSIPLFYLLSSSSSFCFSFIFTDVLVLLTWAWVTLDK